MATANVRTNFSSIATDPLRNFKFQVNIPHTPAGSRPGLIQLGFTSVSGLSVTTESIPYRQGGYNTTVHQIPGQTTFQPITLQRGVMMGTSQAWDWMRQLFSVIAGAGLGTAGRNFRTNFEILVLDHPVTRDGSGGNVGDPDAGTGNGADTPVKMRIKVYNAWITALNYSDLNAGDNALLVEQMTLVHEGFDITWADGSAGSSVDGVIGRELF